MSNITTRYEALGPDLGRGGSAPFRQQQRTGPVEAIRDHPQTQRFVRLFARRDLLLEFVKKDFVVRYHASFLGILWTQLYPLGYLVTFLFTFGLVFHADIKNYPLYLFVGVVFWHLISDSFLLSANAVIINAGVISRIAFPREYVVISVVALAGLDFLVSHIAIAGACLIYGVYPTWSWFALIPLLILTSAFCIGIGLVLATATTYLRDVKWFVDVGVVFLMHLTPIFFSEDMVPRAALWLVWLNPLAWMVAAYRNAILNGAWPSAGTWAGIAGVAAVSLFTGLVVFARGERGFVDAV